MFPLTKILLITILNIFLAASSYAQTTTSTTGNFTFLEKGESAPFKGILFDPVATAKILTDKEMAEKECQLHLQHEKSLLNVQCKKNIDLITSELEIEKRKNTVIVKAQEEEIQALRQLAKGSNNVWWATIGFVVGAATSVTIFYAAVEIAK